ncbi:MAG: DUF4199 domain-containing protein [Chitinophagales bacterium]
MEERNIGLKYGLIAGIVVIAGYLGLFYTDPALLFRRMGMLAFAILLVTMIWTGRVFRRKHGDIELSFREFVRPIFTVFVVSMGVVIVFHYLFYNFSGSGMDALIKEWFLEEGRRQMELANKPPEFIEKELLILENGDYSYGLFKSLQTYVLSLVFGFLMATFIVVGFIYARLLRLR